MPTTTTKNSSRAFLLWPRCLICFRCPLLDFLGHLCRPLCPRSWCQACPCRVFLGHLGLHCPLKFPPLYRTIWSIIPRPARAKFNRVSPLTKCPGVWAATALPATVLRHLLTRKAAEKVPDRIIICWIRWLLPRKIIHPEQDISLEERRASLPQYRQHFVPAGAGQSFGQMPTPAPLLYQNVAKPRPLFMGNQWFAPSWYLMFCKKKASDYLGTYEIFQVYT